MPSVAEIQARLAEFQGFDAMEKELRDEEAGFRVELSKLGGEIEGLKREVTSNDALTNRCVKELERYLAANSDRVCPTCRQKVETPQCQADIDRLGDEIARLQERKDKIGPELEAKRRDEADVRAALEESRRDLVELESALLRKRELESLATKSFQSEFRRNSVTETLAKLKTDLLKIAEEQNPHTDYLEDRARDLFNEQARLSVCEKVIAEAMPKREAMASWEAAFSDKGLPNQPPIKSYIFESVTPLLNQFAADYSSILTAGATQVTFNTVTPLKNGSCAKNFRSTSETLTGRRATWGNRVVRGVALI